MSRNQLRENDGRAADGGAVIPDELIRRRAYERSCRRNNGPSDPVADWYDAERELREEAQARRNRQSQSAVLPH